MNYFISQKTLNCVEYLRLKERVACRRYRREVKDDMDIYFLLAEMEYGDGNCELPEDLTERSLGW
jgi:hypothetical protein